MVLADSFIWLLIEDRNASTFTAIDQTRLRKVEMAPGAKTRAIEKMLAEVAEECAMDNWDGYAAKAVDAETRSVALAVLRSLPDYLGLPDVVGEPGGEIGLEWRSGESILAVVIDKRSRLHYAAIDGNSTERGAIDFGGVFPHRLTELIATITG
jgi:hypothetical protein